MITGRAGAHLLDTYDAERHPVAEQLIAFTAQLMSLAMIQGSADATLRNDTLAAVAGVAGVPDWLANKLSQLDIGYPAPEPAYPVAGKRIDPRVAAPTGLSWTLVTPPGETIPTCPTTSRSPRPGT